MIDVKGQTFGYLTAIKFIKSTESKSGKASWLCKCKCGNEVVIDSYCLRHKKIYSCGCYLKEIVKQKNTKHQGTTKYKRLYNIYAGIKTRCYNSKSEVYKRYGARGIKMCDEWLENFINFKEWALLNGYNENLTIERINYNEDYTPKNCRWANYKEQANNTRRNRIIKINNVSKTFSQWCDYYNLSKSKRNTANSRLQRGWSYTEIFKNI